MRIIARYRIDRAQFAGVGEKRLSRPLRLSVPVPRAAASLKVSSLPIDPGAICKVDSLNHQRAISSGENKNE